MKHTLLVHLPYGQNAKKFCSEITVLAFVLLQKNGCFLTKNGSAFWL